MEEEIRSWLPGLLACGLLAFSLAGWTADEQHTVPDLTVHEWGTFTSIAGKDGRAAEWLPLAVVYWERSSKSPSSVAKSFLAEQFCKFSSSTLCITLY